MVTLTATPTSASSSFAGWSGDCTGAGTCTVSMTAARNVTATFTLLPRTLTVTRRGTGSGTVTSTPGGISCGSDCMETYAHGSTVTLRAAPATGSSFTGWAGGGCTGTGTCTVTMSAATTVTASFSVQRWRLDVDRNGTGSGSVVSAPSGISCGVDCSETYDHGTDVTLTPRATSGSAFAGWSGGGCSGTGTCTVAMTAARSVVATFNRVPRTLTVARAGTGSGSVTSSPTGISCGTDCSESYLDGTSVTLTARPGRTSVFAGWSGGGCSGTGTCTVTLSSAVTVTATFTARRSLSVSLAGTGSGTVTSSPTGINCGTDCSQSYLHGTTVTLSAGAASGSVFTGWSGACTGTDTCTVSMTSSRSVTANFELLRGLTVRRIGMGTGTVTSSPSGISCGADCSQSYPHGETVTLTASASTGSMFAGWSGGGCTGTGVCTLTMSAATLVTATFEPARWGLNVIIGTGSGFVGSRDGGISCEADCGETYSHGTSVTLVVDPGPGYEFDSWSGGGCSGGAYSCTVSMTEARTVTANFRLGPRSLTVRSTGPGRITSSPGSISCRDASCSETFPYNTMVTLTRRVDARNVAFEGWTGATCAEGSQTGTNCTVRMNTNRTVGGAFGFIVL